MDGAEEVKDKIVRGLKKGLKIGLKLAIIFLPVTIVIILISSFVYVIMKNDGSYNEGDWSNPAYVADQLAFSGTSQNTVKGEDGWNMDIDIEKTVDDIIEQLDKNNGALDRYIKEDKQKEYLTAFIKAELITQYPDLRSDVNKIGTETKEGEFQGCIQIHRALSDSTTEILTYIDYDTFNSYITSRNSEATKHFTLDENGDLVVSGWKRVTTSITSNVPDVENVTDRVEYELIAKSIPYKSEIETFSMPFDFLWALTVMSDGDDFPLKLAQLALNSKIIITVQDNLTTIVTETVEEYDIQEKSIQTADLRVTYNGNTTSKTYQEGPNIVDNNYKTETNIKTEICSVNIDITYADTWLYKYENSYSNQIPEESGKTTEAEPEKIDDEQFGEEEDAPIDESFRANAHYELVVYEASICGGEDELAKAKEKETIVGSVTNFRHKKSSRKINQIITNKSTTTYNKYTAGTPTVTEKVDKDATEENFVTLFLKCERAKANILSEPNWLFEMLASGPKTANMVDVLKYLLYKATGNDYGVTELSVKIISLDQFKGVKGGSTENFIKAWENGALWMYETGQTMSIPTKYLTEDGLSYIVYEDGSGGHNNIAYGWATFLTNGAHEVTRSDFGGGRYNWKTEFAKEGIAVEGLYEGALVDKQKATAVFQNEILPCFQRTVDNYLKEYLSDYEFSQAQKDALISICYQYGNISGFCDAYESSLNGDGTINAEKLKSNYSRFNYSGTVNDRKYANWLLFTQGIYIDRSGNEMKVLGGDIVSTAKIIHDYMSDPEHLYYYCLNGGSDYEYVHRGEGLSCGLLSTFEDSQIPGRGGYRLTCCATYVSWVLQELGYIEGHWDSTYIENPLIEKGWTRIDNYDDLEAGDIVFMDTEDPNTGSLDHVQIYVGDGCWYNTGSNWSIHQVEPYYSDERAQFVYAYRKN